MERVEEKGMGKVEVDKRTRTVEGENQCTITSEGQKTVTGFTQTERKRSLYTKTYFVRSFDLFFNSVSLTR